MSKIICDICGTAYPDTANECPICGCSKDDSAALLADDLLEEEMTAAAVPAADPFASAGQKKTLVPDDEDDEYDDYDDDDEYDDDDDDDEDDDDDQKSNAPLVILLVLVILALLAVSAFILVKYFLPTVMGPEETAPPAVETTAAVEDTTELKIPCENLALTSGGEIVLESEGANWLINVLALPDNTTDELVYSSSDEAVATVNEQGKVTAVGEGTAVITITCGEQELKCSVVVSFAPETTAAPEETTEPEEVPDESVPEESDPEETVPEETEAPAEVTGTITASTLNIRETPEANGRILGIYSKGQKVTILEQKTVGNSTWGRTNKGWINMDYVEQDT